MNAAYYGEAGEVKTLIAQGADVNWRDDEERTPLHNASRRRHTDTAILLIQKNADVNAVSNETYTPLIQAAALDNLVLVRALVEAKADMRIRSKNKTAAEWAEEKGNRAISKFLNDTIQSQSAEKDKKDQSNPVEKVGSKGE